MDEAPLDGGLRGGSGFTEWFTAQGVRDRRGRSLHELDLRTRLMRYPCSFTIYSPAFAALPEDVRHALYRRLAAVLSGLDGSPRYAHLSSGDRRAVAEILRETLPDAAKYLQ